MEITTVKLQSSGYLVNDSIHVPNAPGNRDYQEVQDWITAGNTPDPEFTPAELLAKTKAELTAAVQSHLDSEAQAKGFDSILSACSYSTFANTFQAEGQSFCTWRSAVWDYAIQVLADVEAQTRAVPTKEELIAELPVLVF